MPSVTRFRARGYKMYLVMKSGAAVVSGRLNKDAELKVFDSGKMKCTFGFKADFHRGENGSNESKWANCVVWGDLAKEAAMLKEGDTVICTGRFSTREFNNRTYEEINVDAFSLCGAPRRSVDELKTKFPSVVTETQGNPVFVDETDDEGELPF